jgi:sterol 3beta-glucosyltransferase
MPLAVDQFFWGERVAALGAGPRPIPQRAATTEKLADGLAALKNAELHRRARSLADKLKDEDGVTRAVEIISRAV